MTRPQMTQMVADKREGGFELTTDMTKPDMRHRLRAERIRMPEQAVRAKSLRIYRRLIDMPAYQLALRIACYMSIKNEVDTRMVIQNAIGSGKQVGVPVTRKDGDMYFQAIAGLSDLRPVHYGLREPVADPQKMLLPHTVDLILVPGIAFDRRGYRIGLGGGYYDRFLARTEAVRIGLSYDFQIIDRVPAESHDEKMDLIITEDEIIKI